MQNLDRLCICGTNGVYLLDGIMHNDHNEYQHKINITSSNMCFFKDDHNKFVSGCDDHNLVVEDIRIYDNDDSYESYN